MIWLYLEVGSDGVTRSQVKVWLSRWSTFLKCMKPWALWPAPPQTGMVVHTCDPITDKVEAGGGVGNLRPSSAAEFVDSLG